MNRQALQALIVGAILLAGSAGAKEVNLGTGETYRQGDLTVTCGQSATDAPTPMTLNDCQYWDDFSKKCLFEKTTYVYQTLECVEECQYWDKFSSTCHYQTKCTFYPPQRSFVRTTCEKFDDFNKTCEKMKESRIGH